MAELHMACIRAIQPNLSGLAAMPATSFIYFYAKVLKIPYKKLVILHSAAISLPRF